jgi:hypothetical protein
VWGEEKYLVLPGYEGIDFLTAKFAKGFLCWVLMGLVFSRKVRKDLFFGFRWG